MTVKNLSMVNGVLLTASMATLYTAPDSVVGTRIIAFTVLNNDVTPRTYTFHIVPDGGVADSSNIIAKDEILAADEVESVSSTQVHLIPSKGTLQGVASVTDQISVRVSGVEFT